jgi:hypothetical protein
VPFVHQAAMRFNAPARSAGSAPWCVSECDGQGRDCIGLPQTMYFCRFNEGYRASDASLAFTWLLSTGGERLVRNQACQDGMGKHRGHTKIAVVVLVQPVRGDELRQRVATPLPGPHQGPTRE